MNPPGLLQVRRYEDVHLGVTYESEVECESTGLGYTWTLTDAGGQVVPLPLIDVHKQSLILPRYLLDYGTYTATARVRAKHQTCCFCLGESLGENADTCLMSQKSLIPPGAGFEPLASNLQKAQQSHSLSRRLKTSVYVGGCKQRAKNVSFLGSLLFPSGTNKFFDS